MWAEAPLLSLTMALGLREKWGEVERVLNTWPPFPVLAQAPMLTTLGCPAFLLSNPWVQPCLH